VLCRTNGGRSGKGETEDKERKVRGGGEGEKDEDVRRLENNSEGVPLAVGP